MLDRFIMPPLNRALQPLGRVLVGWEVKANNITISAFALSVVGCVFIAFQFYTIALAILVVARLGDAIDGLVARATMPTRFGAVLDISCDFIFYAAFVAAFAIANPSQNAVAAVVLLVSFSATAATFLSYAIQQAADAQLRLDLPRKGFYYIGGLCEGSETYLVFLLMLLIPSWFSLLAWVFAIACFITAITRLIYAYKTL